VILRESRSWNQFGGPGCSMQPLIAKWSSCLCLSPEVEPRSIRLLRLLNETTSSTFSKRANGKVAGRDGAAAKLGMKRTTFPIMLTAYGTFRESQYCAPLESGAAWW